MGNLIHPKISNMYDVLVFSSTLHHVYQSYKIECIFFFVFETIRDSFQ